MAKGTPFKIDPTSTTIGRLLRLPDTFFVPQYQRDFSWTDLETRELWEDFESLLTGERKAHYLGAIVVIDTGDTGLEVVDGQQRLTSLSLLINEIRRYLTVNNRASSATLFSSLVDKIDAKTEESEPRLKLNETNSRIYETIHAGEDPKLDAAAANRSNKLLIKARSYFEKMVAKYFEQAPEIGDAARALEKTLNSLLHVTLIKVSDTESAFLIFETLNQRGLELSVSDLMKNHMLSIVKTKENRKLIRRHWDGVSANLPEGDITSFVRHYWLSKKEVIREREIFKAIKSECKDAKAAINFAAQLFKSSAIYGGLQSYKTEAWTGLSDRQKHDFSNDLTQINICGLTQCYPVLLAALQDTPKIAADVCRLMLAFSFRYSIIGGGGTGNLEKFYSDLAIEIRKTKPTNISQIFASVKRLYPSDTAFKENFGKKSEKNGRIARYVLRCLIDKSFKSKTFHSNASAQVVNLEHILPQKPKPNSGWNTAFSQADVTEYTYRLGNLALLEVELNSDAGNLAFHQKKSILKKSSIRMNRELAKLPSWTPTAIEARQKKMAVEAAKIWRFDV